MTSLFTMTPQQLGVRTEFARVKEIAWYGATPEGGRLQNLVDIVEDLRDRDPSRAEAAWVEISALLAEHREVIARVVCPPEAPPRAERFGEHTALSRGLRKTPYEREADEVPNRAAILSRTGAAAKKEPVTHKGYAAVERGRDEWGGDAVDAATEPQKAGPRTQDWWAAQPEVLDLAQSLLCDAGELARTLHQLDKANCQFWNGKNTKINVPIVFRKIKDLAEQGACLKEAIKVILTKLGSRGEFAIRKKRFEDFLRSTFKAEVSTIHYRLSLFYSLRGGFGLEAFLEDHDPEPRDSVFAGISLKEASHRLDALVVSAGDSPRLDEGQIFARHGANYQLRSLLRETDVAHAMTVFIALCCQRADEDLHVVIHRLDVLYRSCLDQMARDYVMSDREGCEDKILSLLLTGPWLAEHDEGAKHDGDELYERFKKSVTPNLALFRWDEEARGGWNRYDEVVSAVVCLAPAHYKDDLLTNLMRLGTPADVRQTLEGSLGIARMQVPPVLIGTALMRAGALEEVPGLMRLSIKNMRRCRSIVECRFDVLDHEVFDDAMLRAVVYDPAVFNTNQGVTSLIDSLPEGVLISRDTPLHDELPAKPHPVVIAQAADDSYITDAVYDLLGEGAPRIRDHMRNGEAPRVVSDGPLALTTLDAARDLARAFGVGVEFVLPHLRQMESVLREVVVGQRTIELTGQHGFLATDLNLRETVLSKMVTGLMLWLQSAGQRAPVLVRRFTESLEDGPGFFSLLSLGYDFFEGERALAHLWQTLAHEKILEHKYGGAGSTINWLDMVAPLYRVQRTETQINTVAAKQAFVMAHLRGPTKIASVLTQGVPALRSHFVIDDTGLVTVCHVAGKDAEGLEVRDIVNAAVKQLVQIIAAQPQGHGLVVMCYAHDSRAAMERAHLQALAAQRRFKKSKKDAAKSKGGSPAIEFKVMPVSFDAFHLVPYNRVDEVFNP
ncbi:MAG: hypothetical protein HQM16_18330 [Deltaproteobacteria bacterium]|nr:hypothetical protein [Deltaproteobacteria bacterium]